MKFDFQSHLDGGKYEKRVWFWPFKWYVEPIALGYGEWDISDCYFQTNYPVQYFIRESVRHFLYRHVTYRYKELKWDVKGCLRNPRKEMRDKLFPIRWNDLTETIVQFHLETIIEFVDREKCFDIIDYSSDDSHKDFAAGLKDCHYYATTTRPALHLKLDKAHEAIPYNSDLPFTEMFKDVISIEKEIEEYDEKVCEWVIKNRKMFWC